MSAKTKPRFISRDVHGYVKEHFLELDTEGRIIVKDGRTLEEYFNHPSQVAMRKERNKPLKNIPMILIAVDAYERMLTQAIASA